MAIINTLIDRIVVVFLTVVVVIAPLDVSLLLPFRDGSLSSLLTLWHKIKYGEYLSTQRPAFFVALLWIGIALLFPLAIMILYGLLRRPQPPQWLQSTALIFGASYCTIMITITAELKSLTVGSVSPTMLKLYPLFIACGTVVILRGMLPCRADGTPTSRQLKSRSSENKKGT